MIRLNSDAALNSRKVQPQKESVETKSTATSNTSTQTIFDNVVDSYYDKKNIKNKNASDKTSAQRATTSKYLELQQMMHKKVTTEYKAFNPHVSGFYYIQMVPGTWVRQVLHNTPVLFNSQEVNNQYNEFSNPSSGTFGIMHKEFGKIATDIDIPQLNMEYEVISGKARSLNYASRTQFTGDFSINFIENYNLDIFRYHELWFKYIDALRKGYIVPPKINKKTDNENMFMEIPYFNAVWVAIFAPFTTKIRGLIKIMGVSPLNLPFKQIVGDRAKNTMTTINQNYKSNDMIHKFFENDEDLLKSSLYADFMLDMDMAVQNHLYEKQK